MLSRGRFATLLAVIGLGVVTAIGAEADKTSGRREQLQAARTWMYQIDGLNPKSALNALAESSYPLLVVDSGINEKDSDVNSARKLVSRLRTRPDGQPRLLLAYIDIGQAENYRDYWKSDWKKPTKGAPGQPDFLLAIDPDGWNGSYQVAFWDPRWQEIWLGPEGTIARLAQLGFDGIYLDWIDAYTDSQVVRAARRAGLDPALEMVQFIERLGNAGRKITPDFLVVAQNASELIDAAPDRYARAIDALAVEDTWYYGKGGAKWDHPKAGDLNHHDEDPQWTPENRLTQYRKYLDRKLPVFSVDYCVSDKNAARVYHEARVAGLRPLVTRVPLSKMTVTPPEKYPDSSGE
jgi:cysteinyl-tRNA synthetase